MKTLRLVVAVALAAGVVAGNAVASTRDFQGSPAADGVAAELPAMAAATATSKQLWLSSTLDAIANDVVGTTDMKTLSEDDPAEWATFFPPDVDSHNVLGFTSLTFAPLYHVLLLSPYVESAFAMWFTAGTPTGNEYPFAIAGMTLVHEAFHWRLFSADESLVNACALKYFPYYLAKDMNVPQTVTQTTTQQVPVTTTTQVPQTRTVVTRKRVKVKGKWTTRTTRKQVTTYVTKTTTTYETQTVTSNVPNALYNTIVADASDFYSHQPPPYNAGTCSV